MKWEIEANIDCCDSCRKRVEKYLKGVEGVESVDLYPEISKVVVMGDADPDSLLHEVKRVKEKAVLRKAGLSPAKNSGAMGDLGRHSEEDNKKKKKNKLADGVIHGRESEKAITVYKPPKPSNGRDKVASESKTYGANLSAYGFGAGFLYRWAKTYKR